jgi:hypothetical protein
MPWTNPETFTAGQTLTAASMNLIQGNIVAVARGVVTPSSGSNPAKATTNQTGITSVADITSMIVTWSAESSRLYRMTLYLPAVYVTATGGYVIGSITDGSNTQKALAQSWVGNTERVPMIVQSLESGLSGSTTRKGRFNGNGATVTLELSATQPGFILVEDIGPA